ncbi:hypothetical protein COOONC_24682 [Cooperia oncophora]
MSEKLFNQISTIVELRQQGKSIAVTEPSLYYQAVRRFIMKFEGTTSSKKSYVPRALRVHNDEILREIERCYQNNSSATAQDVVKRLKTRGITVSLTHIKRLRQKVGYKEPPHSTATL